MTNKLFVYAKRATASCLIPKNLSRMLLHLYFLRTYDTSNDTILIGDEGCAKHAHGNLALHFLLPIDSECCNESFLRIANEREGQGILLYEFLV